MPRGGSAFGMFGGEQRTSGEEIIVNIILKTFLQQTLCTIALLDLMPGSF